MKKALAVYTIILGMSIISFWLMIFSTQSLPQGKIEIGFHILSEIAMAISCIISGAAVIRNWKPAFKIFLISHAMVIDSALNAAGYYGETGKFPVMYLFLALFMISVFCIYYLIVPTKWELTYNQS